MNFLSNAMAMAKVAAEKGADGLTSLTAKVSEATGVEMPSSFSVISPAVNPTTSAIVQEEEEEEEQPCKFGRIQFKLDYNFDKTTLAVTIFKCEDLPAMDAGGTSDPYVRVWVNPDKKKAFCTKKLKKTLNPVYNETFTFLKLPFNEMDGKVLIMAIYDHDALGSDDQIGEVTLPLSSVDLASEETIWKDIKEPPSADALGDLCLSLRYKPASKPPALVCQIVQCRNLKQMDLGGASDPYVKYVSHDCQNQAYTNGGHLDTGTRVTLHSCKSMADFIRKSIYSDDYRRRDDVVNNFVNHMLNGKRVKKYKTVVQMSNLNPYWNTSFKIPVNPVDIQNIELHIYVNDFDKFGGNDTIGWLCFSLTDKTTAGTHWREAISQPKTNITKWHPLQPLEDDKK